MNEQQAGLPFDQPPPDNLGKHPYAGHAPFASGSETSAEAARKVEPRLETIRGRVLAYFRSCGARGSTDDQAVETFGAEHHNTIAPRRTELVKLGLIIKTCRRRETRNGGSAAVWVAAEHFNPEIDR